MQEIFLELIRQLNSSVLVLFLILVIVCIVLFKLGEWTNKFKTHDEKVEKLENMADQVISLTTKVDLIYQFTNPHSPIKSHSPLSFTSVGEAILKNIDANGIFEKYKSVLVLEVEKMVSDGNAYDIQQAALSVARSKMLGMLNEQELIKVKDEAFQQGLLIEDIMGVFGLILRNQILNPKGIPLAEVDKHDLAKKKF